nr:hypothetical protein [Tanacetum cinerariifolium]
MGIEGIAKVEWGCVVGCDRFLDTRGGGEEVLAPSQSALFLTSHFSPFIIPKDLYTKLVDILGVLPNDTQALSGLYMTPSSIHRQLAGSYSNHDPELEVSAAERTIQDAKRIEQEVDLLDLFHTPDVKVLQSKR